MFLGEIDVGHSWDLKGINLGVWETAHLPLPYDDDKKRGKMNSAFSLISFLLYTDLETKARANNN